MRNGSAILNLFDGAPATTNTSSPAYGASGVSTTPSFTWNPITSATSYEVEIASDIDFLTVIDMASVPTASYTLGTTLTNNTIYYWRVRANNDCGTGNWSDVSVFETAPILPCSDVIVEGDFEGGPNSAWGESSSNGYVIVDNTSGTFNSGIFSAWLAGANNEVSTVSQNVTISPTATTATLTYYYYIFSNEALGDCIYDYAYLYVDGAIATTYPLCADNNTTAYQMVTFDLSPYIGSTIEIRFQAETDASVTSNFFVDDVAVEVCESVMALCSAPIALPAQLGVFTADMECTDADGWTHYWKSAAMAPATPTDIVLLSIEKDGTVDIEPSQITIGVSGIGGASDLSGLPYVTNPDGWFVMNRFWDINPTVQPGPGGVKIRFYYTKEDYDGLSNAVSNSPAGGSIAAHSELVCYKFATGSGINPDPAAIPPHVGGNLTNYLEFVGDYQPYFAQHRFEYTVSGFSGGGIGAGGGGAGTGALPVELISFEGEATAKGNLLEWSTASEVDNDYFDVEHSLNGRDFLAITQVDGAGSSNEILDYSYLHSNPEIGTNFYRLKQVDYDGRTSYSEVISIKTTKSYAFDLSPNPVENILSLNFETLDAGEIKVTIYDVAGKVIREFQPQVAIGRNTIVLDIEELAAGTYYVNVEQGLIGETKKMIKL